MSTLSFFQKFHRKEDLFFDETGAQVSAYWNFTKIIGVGPSLYYNSITGFSKKISFLIFREGKNMVFVAVPSVVHAEKDGSINGDLFIQLQYSKPVKNEWSFLAYTQLLTNWYKFSTHARSFQQIRIGAAFKNNQFGLAADFDEYGTNPLTKITVGIFFRKVFFETQKKFDRKKIS